MSILSIKQFSQTEIDDIFKRARYIREFPLRYVHELDGRVMATLFFEPSTRTKLSFESAMSRLGGSYISPGENSSLKKGESLENMVQCIAQYVDVMVIRHKNEDMVGYLDKFSDVPVINAGSGAAEHPTQALLDLFTITDLLPKKTAIKILFTGDLLFSRTIRSLLPLLSMYPELFHCYFVLPVWRHEAASIVVSDNLKHEIIAEPEIEKVIKEVDILYMTRRQVERHTFSEYCCPEFALTSGIANSMKEDAIILHPLPSNKELPVEINKNPRAKYFEQAKNGMWVRMALLWEMLKNEV